MEAGKTGFGACSRVDLGEFVLAKTGCIRSILNVRGKLLLFFNPCYMAHWSWCSSVNVILEIDCEQLLNQIHYAEDHVEWLLVSLSFLYYSSLYSQSYCNWNELILLLTKKKKIDTSTIYTLSIYLRCLWENWPYKLKRLTIKHNM